ncbi:MAG: ATP-binding protein, partial [Phormidesmis sp.]
EIEQLQAQVNTLEELLQLYQQSATENEQRFKAAFQNLQERAQQLGHAKSTLQTLQTILDSMGDAVVVVDATGLVLFSNPAAKQMLSSESSERSFHRWIETHEIFTSDGVTPYRIKELPITRAIRGESVDAAEMWVVEQSSRAGQWLSVNARPLQADDQVSGAVAVFQDISRRKQFEYEVRRSHEETQQQAQLLEKALKQLKYTQAKLIQKEKMNSLGQTVAGLAHEINNPVSFIHGNIGPTEQAVRGLLGLVALFQETYPEPTGAIATAIEDIDLAFLAKDIPHMLTSMRAGTERIRGIVKSLRTFSRLDESEIKCVDIHQGIDSALMLLQSQLDKAAISVRKVYGDLPSVECSAGQLNQVIVNLLSNAIGAMDDSTASPEIIICTEAFVDYTAITVSDNGVGIAEEIQPSIFDPFFTTKPVGQGMGLGLSICHQIIVETHGGSLECVSEVGKGSQFIVKLPHSFSCDNTLIDFPV